MVKRGILTSWCVDDDKWYPQITPIDADYFGQDLQD